MSRPIRYSQGKYFVLLEKVIFLSCCKNVIMELIFTFDDIELKNLDIENSDSL